jgi:hypothetical protein
VCAAGIMHLQTIVSRNGAVACTSPRHSNFYDLSTACKNYEDVSDGDLRLFAMQSPEKGTYSYIIETKERVFKNIATGLHQAAYFEVITGPTCLYFDVEFLKELNPHVNGSQCVWDLVQVCFTTCAVLHTFMMH